MEVSSAGSLESGFGVRASLIDAVRRRSGGRGLTLAPPAPLAPSSPPPEWNAATARKSSSLSRLVGASEGGAGADGAAAPPYPPADTAASSGFDVPASSGVDSDMPTACAFFSRMMDTRARFPKSNHGEVTIQKPSCTSLARTAARNRT